MTAAPASTGGTLRGFSKPFSPDGSAAVLAPWPYDFSIRSILIPFRVAPDSLLQAVPAPLTPVPGRAGEAFWMVIDHVMSPVTVDSSAWHPERTRMLEALVGIPSAFDGVPGVYIWESWTDREWSFVMELLSGAGGKLARIAVTEHHRLHPTWSGAGDGARYQASVERHGERVTTASLTLEEQISPDRLPTSDLFRPYLLRHLPNLDVNANGRPLVHDLSAERISGNKIGAVWRGRAELSFGNPDNEWTDPVRDAAVSEGYYLEASFRSEGVEVLHDYLADESCWP